MVISPTVPTIIIISETIILEVPAIIALPVVSHPLPVTDPEVVRPLGTALGVQPHSVGVRPLATAPGAQPHSVEVRPLVIEPEPEVQDPLARPEALTLLLHLVPLILTLKFSC